MKGNSLSPIALTRSQARKFLLAYQSLWPPRDLLGKEGVLEYIRRVHCIQFDPLDRAGPNAELVLQSRVSNFKPTMLRELLYQDRLLLDGYDKNMAIYPLEDWPYFNRRRTTARYGLRSSDAVQSISSKVIEAIGARGPLSSLDLDFDQEVEWYWAPTRLSRAALESLYLCGELIIHRKNHTRKYYDLASRHIPTSLLDTADPNLSENDYQDWYVLRRIGSIGLLWNRGSGWMGVPATSVQRSAVLKHLVEKGEVLEVNVDGIDAPFYMRTRDKIYLDNLLNTDNEVARASFIAPLDNLMWDRQLLEELFGFYYRWEVYVPAIQRKYGYYVLPVLYGDQFVARFEPVRNRKTGALTIVNWWWEQDIQPTQDIIDAISECFEYFSTYLDITQLNINGIKLTDIGSNRLAITLADMAPKR